MKQKLTYKWLLSGRQTKKVKQSNVDHNLKLKLIHTRIEDNNQHDKIKFLRAIVHNLKM